jgi:hypothetical protein
MTVQPGQKVLTTGLPAITAAAPGLMPIDNGSPLVSAIPVGGGTVTLNGATPITVVDARVGAGSIIVFTLKTVGGTVSPNAPNILTITPGTGFTVAGTASDTSVYNFAILG